MVEAYDHMFMIGDALAGGIAKQFPDKFPAGSATTSAVDLRVTLGKELGKHAALAAMATQKGLGGDATKPQFTAAADLLEANTVALGGAIKSVYGDDAEKTFLTLWRNHIGFFVDYTVGTAKGEEAGRMAALDKLAGYRAQFGQFLAGADPNLTTDGVSGLLQTHVNQLTAALDTYKAGEFADAYTQVRAAHAHMFIDRLRRARRPPPYTRSDEHARPGTHSAVRLSGSSGPVRSRSSAPPFEGRDTLALMPTGSGKSLTLPAPRRCSAPLRRSCSRR